MPRSSPGCSRRRAAVLVPAGDESGIPVLLLDDAHSLDASSLAVIDRLMSQGALFCIATVVVGAPVPDAVTRWWRDERAARIDLGELDEIDVDTLLHIALEGPLTPGRGSGAVASEPRQRARVARAGARRTRRERPRAARRRVDACAATCARRNGCAN